MDENFIRGISFTPKAKWLGKSSDFWQPLDWAAWHEANGGLFEFFKPHLPKHIVTHGFMWRDVEEICAGFIGRRYTTSRSMGFFQLIIYTPEDAALTRLRYGF